MLAWALLHLVSVLLADGKGTPIQRYASGKNADYDAAINFLWENDVASGKIANKGTIASWNYASNLTEHNKEVMLKTQAKQVEFVKETWKNATSFAWKGFKDTNETIHRWIQQVTKLGTAALPEDRLKKLKSQAKQSKFGKETWKNATSFSWKGFKDMNETIYRWFQQLTKLGTAAFPEDKLKKFNTLVADMQDVYSKAKVCAKDSPAGKPCDLSLDPELTEILKGTRDYKELKRVWSDWRNATGRKMRGQFLEYVKLSNEAAKLNGFKDAGEMWRDNYESDTFEKDVEDLWKVIEPFYKQLHAFVRRRLIQQYPGSGIQQDGPIPAHLLGSMWAQSWGNIFDIVKPYKQKAYVDVSNRMKERNMTALDMFKMSEEFFTSLGLKPMTEEFWNRSIIEKPKDREIICHASAWDFSDGKDFRIKMCTKINMGDLITVHHEMGHIQYYQQYAHQPAVFRDGANPAFHEAVGDVLALSVATSSHLKKVGLMSDSDEDEEMEINKLMETALDKVPFLPSAYLIDSWRWKVFSGEFSEDELNSKWWEQRLKYQGLCPPVRRTNEDLDAAAKYHVIADVPYIRYFLSYILQFQFHKALCEAAGHEGPLHQCDIYQNKEAGKLLSNTLSLGSSVHWSEAMSVITRNKTRQMDAQPLMEYFAPLVKWLEKQNEGKSLGWKSNDPMMCPENP